MTPAKDLPEQLYKIRTLQWGQHNAELYPDWWGADVPGSYRVEKRDDGTWFWGFCHDEYYHEGQEDCDDLEDGKAKAQKHYNEWVENYLTPATREASDEN